MPDSIVRVIDVYPYRLCFAKRFIAYASISTLPLSVASSMRNSRRTRALFVEEDSDDAEPDGGSDAETG